jgi:uncharacterized membrane protein (DUF2068 family)
MALGEVRRQIKSKELTIVGTIVILLWLSSIPYLFAFPFGQHEGLKRLAKQLAESPEAIKELAGIGGKSERQLDRDLQLLFIVQLIKDALTVLIGIGAGVLIIKRKRVGRYLAVGMCVLVLGYRIYSEIRHFHSLRALSYKYFLLFEGWPVMLIRDCTLVALTLVILLYLIRPSVGKEFNT